MSDTVLLLSAGGLITLVVVVVLLFRPFTRARPSGAEHEGGSHAWIGADDGGGDGGGD